MFDLLPAHFAASTRRLFLHFLKKSTKTFVVFVNAPKARFTDTSIIYLMHI